MAKTARIQARIEENLKEEVSPILKELGLSLTDAITLFLKQITLRRGLPFRVNIPNKETIKAIEDVNAGKGVSRYASDEEMFKDLGI